MAKGNRASQTNMEPGPGLLTREQLEGKLWAAADFLRGSIDSSDEFEHGRAQIIAEQSEALCLQIPRATPAFARDRTWMKYTFSRHAG